MFLRALLLSCLLLSLVGCGGKGYVSYPVKGTVKFADGSVPAGEVATILFTPVTTGTGTKGASGQIGVDGTFSLSTIDPEDGAFPGEYKVTLNVFKTYVGRESLVDAKFANPATTPLVAKVGPNEQNTFDFVVEKVK